MEEQPMDAVTAPGELCFEALVREHQERVYLIALRVLNDPAHAEDVTQQVFLALYQARGIPRPVANPTAYFARMTVNYALQVLRSERRRTKREEEAISRKDPAMTPDDLAFRGEVREAVGRLPVDLRLPVVLHYFEGMAYEEVAEALEIPSGTVASRIHLAKGQLREALAGVGFGLLAAGLEAALREPAAVPFPSHLTDTLLSIPKAGASVVPAGASLVGKVLPLALLLATLGVSVVAVLLPGGPTPRRGVSSAAPGPLVTEAHDNTRPVPTHPPGEGARGSGPTAVSSNHHAEEEVREGFLVSHPDGSLRLTDEEAPTALNDRVRQVKRIIAPPNVLTEESAALFASLKGEELVRVRLRATTRLDEQPIPGIGNAPLEPGEAPESAEVGTNWVTVDEILSVEAPSTEWRARWTEGRKALERLSNLSQERPSKGRREQFISTIHEVLHHLKEMGRLRTVQAPPAALASFPMTDDWQRRREREVLRALRDRTDPFGLTPPAVPEVPTEEETLRSLLDAKDQAALRQSLISGYGEGVLDDEVSFWRPDRSGRKWMSERMRVVLLEWTPEEFQAVQFANREAGRIKKDPKPEPPEYEEHRARVRATGLEVVELTLIERQTYLVTAGVGVRAVTRNSPAEQAGLKVGDILWRVQVPANGKMTPSGLVEVEIANPANFGFLLGEAREMDSVLLDVLRQDHTESVSLSLRSLR